MRGEEIILKNLSHHKPADLAISIITYAEINYGIEKSPHRKTERKNKINAIVENIKVLPLDMAAAIHYSKIRVHLKKKGIIISERDLQIAAIAKSEKLCLLTHNTSEFARVPGLDHIDWYY